MKKFVLLVLLAAVVFVLPVAAQNFSSPKAQFISFSLGVPVGYNINTEEIAAGRNLGINFAIIDNLLVGYDYLYIANKATGTPANDASTYNLIRLAYSFTDNFGAAVSFGSHTDNGTPGGGGAPVYVTTAAAGFGAYADFFQNRSSIGFAYGFRLRVDYLAPTADFGKGALLFGIGANFGI
jgi:hypothetical protein